MKKTAEIMVAIDIEGNIRKCTPLKDSTSNLSLEEFDRIIRKETVKGYAVGFIQKDINITEELVEKKIKELVEALQYSKAHKLKPGVNISGNKKYYSIKKKLAKKLGMKE